ncbi:MAG: efflux RND transporter periplasmic adaptor subunit [Bacteroidales bacterium]|nr:efflux RND transporter periplasmic adaptor subunit [Bacteroidales bacterium]
MKKKTIIIIAVAALVFVVLVLAVVLMHPKEMLQVNSDDAVQGTIENTITATGEIQPVYKVDVGTQVSGIVEKLYVDYNSEVKKGQLLAELDKSTLNEAVKQSKASLSTAQSSKLLAQKNFDRIAALYEKKAATQEEYDQAETQLQQAKNQLITAQSNYENALTNLKYAEIYSPIDGIILSKSVEEGQTVASAFSTPTIFTIAKNLVDMQVEADVDEADIGAIRDGQQVFFSVDAFPLDQFSGSVRQIRLEPTVTSNVVTYKVIIDAPNPDGKLFPGMTANISILTDKDEGVLVSLEATTLEIDPEMEAYLQKNGYTVQRSQAGPEVTTVFVQKQKTLEERIISTGLGDGVNVVVKSGVEEGETVVRSLAKVRGKQKEKGGVFQMGPPERKKR